MLRPVISMIAIMCLFTPAAADSKTPIPWEPASASSAVTLEDIDALQQAVTDAWSKMPLTVRRVMFVTEKAPLLGAYTKRPTNVFKAGEKLLTYIELVGYTWKQQGNMLNFGATVDFVIKGSDGKILGGQENFAKLSLARPEVIELPAPERLRKPYCQISRFSTDLKSLICCPDRCPPAASPLMFSG